MDTHPTEPPPLGRLAIALLRQPEEDWPSTLGRFTQAELASALRAMLEDEAAVEAIARRSYAHGNGFTKLVLARADGLTLRLHVAEGEAEDNLHDHRWPFASAVVAGHLENLLFEENAAGLELMALRYTRSGEGAEAEPIGSVRVREVSRRRVEAGEAYGQGHALLHRIRWGAGCVTLVATGRPVAAHCRLLSTREAPKLRGAPLEPDQVRALLEGCLAGRPGSSP